MIRETVSIFTDYGEGTPSPWKPPKKLVVLGIYRNVRNPMVIGVWCVLVRGSILFRSVELLVRFLVFYTACMFIIPLWEKKDLEKVSCLLFQALNALSSLMCLLLTFSVVYETYPFLAYPLF